MSAEVGAYLTLSFVIAAFYSSLSGYVLVHRRRDAISWVFAALCLSLAITYLINLFLAIPETGDLSWTIVPIRIRWAVISLGPVLFLHLNAFFFPLRWRRVIRKWLPWLYALSVILAACALLTSLVVISPKVANTVSVNWEQGPLFRIFWLLLGLSILVGVGGLLAGYRQAHSQLLRQQIVYMLIPMVLLVVATVLPGQAASGYQSNVITNAVKGGILVIGLLYTRAVLDYGTIVGRPLSRWGFFLLIVAIFGGSAIFGGLLALDGFLANYTPFPLPILSTLAVIGLAASYRKVHGFFVRLQRQLSLPEVNLLTVEEQPAFRALRGGPNGPDVAEQFLQAMCSTFHARGGFLAVRTARDEAVVLHTWQLAQPAVQTAVSLPLFLDDGPHLVTAYGSLMMPEPFWQEMVLICPLALQDQQAMLVLAEKADRSAFTYADIEYSTRLVRWFDELLQRAAHAAAPQPKATRLPVALPTRVDTAVQQPGEPAPEPPLAVYALRALTVAHAGVRASQELWGSEKAKGMLAYLLWRGEEGATREALCDALWPDRDDDCKNIFHVTLHRLRRVLEPERERGSAYVVFEHGRYHLRADASIWIDVQVFERLVRQGDVAALAAAVDLYGAGYLEDVAWALPVEAEIERRRLEGLYERALRQLVAQLPEGEREEHLLRLIRLNPNDDAANQMLLGDYLMLGRADLAQAHMEWLRKMTD